MTKNKKTTFIPYSSKVLSVQETVELNKKDNFNKIIWVQYKTVKQP